MSKISSQNKTMKWDIPKDCLTEKEAYTRLNISCEQFRGFVKEHGINSSPIKPFTDPRKNIMAKIRDNSETYYTIQDIVRLGSILNIKPINASMATNADILHQNESLMEEVKKLRLDLNVCMNEKDQWKVIAETTRPIESKNRDTILLLRSELDESNTEKDKCEKQIKILEKEKKDLQKKNEHLEEKLKEEKSLDGWKHSLKILVHYSLMLGLGNIAFDAERDEMTEKETKKPTRIPRNKFEDFIGKDLGIKTEAIRMCCDVLSKDGAFNAPGQVRKNAKATPPKAS